MLAVAPVASAQSIFVCKEKDGSVVYRDFPCPSDSEATTFTNPVKTDAQKPKTAHLAAEKGLRAGMSKNEVRSILGQPKEITQEEGVDGRVDTWSYGPSRTLQFDPSGHLVQ
jgi:hypothetical protein